MSNGDLANSVVCVVCLMYDCVVFYIRHKPVNTPYLILYTYTTHESDSSENTQTYYMCIAHPLHNTSITHSLASHGHTGLFYAIRRLKGLFRPKTHVVSVAFCPYQSIHT